MKFTWKKQIVLLAVGASLVGLLTGCGSSTNATSGNGNSSNTASSQSGNGNASHKGNFNIAQRFQDAGASQTDAQDLAQLVRQNHINPTWVITQLKNKVTVSSIKDDINNGKAPKAVRKGNGNGNGNWNNNSGSNNGGSANSNNSSSSDSNSSNGGSSF